jgi:hypothetical protein
MLAFVVPTKLSDDHPSVRSLVGGDWLDRRVEAAVVAMKQRNDFSPSMIGMTLGRLAHPLVAELFAVRRGYETETPYLDLLEIDLRTLGPNLPVDLQQRMRVDEEAPKVVHELRIAAGLTRLGHRVSWLPDEGTKRPEMLVDPDTSHAISVECKKRDRRDGYEADAERFWGHFQDSMRRRMEEEGLNYWVKVTANEFRLRDVDLIVRQAVDALRANEAGTASLGGGHYQLHFLRLSDPGRSIPGEVLALIPRGVFGVNHGEVDRSDWIIPRSRDDAFSRGPVTNPKAIRLELPDDPSRRIRGVLRNLKTAAKQLLSNAPGLVYIDLSFRDYDQESSDFESVGSAVTSALERAHRRATAVVLSAIEPTNLMDGLSGWWVRTELIGHSNPLHPFPASHGIPGDESSRWLPGQWFRPTRVAADPTDPAPMLPWGEPVAP